ncbi:MAG: hypothetical protein UX28_C0001G0331 [Candidatus Pacebacteria bacterium GW2011_GWA1_46_10]|nr:MAG: hypothetical protein UX28_C0001G0331 [Candidatus Pacebacteria bacterium GW2011_GWA1_46_10]HCR81490.1 hypothetical protein [Candidatus Paceibacterota bacterium]
MNDKKFIIAVVAVTAFLLLGGIVLATRMTNPKPSAQIPTNTASNAKAAVIDESSLDWGNIVMSEGNKEATFKIKNEGTDPLKLSEVVTSCACTTAQLKLGDTVSPAFGMHNKSAYVFEVPPQQEAKLIVVFDPAFHGPNGVGPIDRFVTVATNDPSQPQLQFSVKGIVSR